MIGLEELEGLVDTLILIPNDKLIELAPDLPLHTAFKVADEILTNAVKGMLPHNRLGRELLTHLKVYQGELHPHAAQQPQTITF